MVNNISNTYLYIDKKLGDKEEIIVNTNKDVFYPTTTTVLLLRAVRRFSKIKPKSVLDLGCGCGIVAVVLAKTMLKLGRVCASDISNEAVSLARYNAQQNKIAMECRSGSLFEPWQGNKFDLIVDDVAGMAEPIARNSKWYPPQIASDAGRDGTRWIVRILEQAPNYLTEKGYIFFPVLSLSNEKVIHDTARERFKIVKLLEEQWYPFDEHLLSKPDLIRELAEEGIIHVKEKGSRLLWSTKVFAASNQ